MYNKKLVISGKYVEVYSYGIPVQEGKTLNPLGRAGTATEHAKMKNRYDSQKRAQKTVRRLANANEHILNKFLTLTYAENQTNTKQAKKDFNLFIKRLDYWLKTSLGLVGHKMQYIVVVEFQQRGAVHFHLLCNMPYLTRAQLKELAEIWGFGWVKLRRQEITNYGAYLAKYMAKDLADERLKGEKCYMTSRGLQKPREYKGKEAELLEEVLASVETSVPWVGTFENDYLGTVQYQQYKLKNHY